MSETTFRAVVAGVLVGALVLATVTLVVLLPRTAQPSPAPSGTPGAGTSSPTAVAPLSQAPPTVPPRAFGSVDVVSVGLIPRGGVSGSTLVLSFLEPNKNAIPDAPGSFQVTLTDHAGSGTTVAFTGTPSVVAPGSLGATARLVAPNILRVSIVASDQYNVELMTITGLGIRAGETAALGSLDAEMGAFAGSLAGGVTHTTLASPGSVVTGP